MEIPRDGHLQPHVTDTCLHCPMICTIGLSALWDPMGSPILPLYRGCADSNLIIPHLPSEARFIPTNTKHLYSIYTMSDQRRRRRADIVWVLYKCFVFAGISRNPPTSTPWWFNAGPSSAMPAQHLTIIGSTFSVSGYLALPLTDTPLPRRHIHTALGCQQKVWRFHWIQHIHYDQSDNLLLQKAALVNTAACHDGVRGLVSGSIQETIYFFSAHSYH